MPSFLNSTAVSRTLSVMDALFSLVLPKFENSHREE
jgi:hypothetical protein